MQHFIDGLPWSVKQSGRGLGALLMALVGSFSEVVAPFAYLGGGILALWLVVGSILHFVNLRRAKFGHDPVSIEPNHILIVCLAGALGAAIWGQLRAPSVGVNSPAPPPVAAPAASASGPQYVKDIKLTETLPLVTVSATVAMTTDRMRVFVDVLPGVGSSFVGGVPKYRAQVKEVRDAVNNQVIPIQLIESSADKPTRFYWGDPKNNYPVLPMSKVRVVLIGPDNSEQHLLYFMVVPGIENQPFAIIRNWDLGWVAEWGNQRTTNDVAAESFKPAPNYFAKDIQRMRGILEAVRDIVERDAVPTKAQTEHFLGNWIGNAKWPQITKQYDLDDFLTELRNLKSQLAVVSGGLQKIRYGTDKDELAPVLGETTAVDSFQMIVAEWLTTGEILGKANVPVHEVIKKREQDEFVKRGGEFKDWVSGAMMRLQEKEKKLLTYEITK